MLFIRVSKCWQKMKIIGRKFWEHQWVHLSFKSGLKFTLPHTLKQDVTFDLILCPQLCENWYNHWCVFSLLSLYVELYLFHLFISAQPMVLFVDCCQLSVCWRWGTCQVVMSPWRWMYHRFRAAGYNGKATRSVTVLHQAAAGSISGVAPATDKRESWRGREQEREGEGEWWVSNRKEKLGRESE